jgi:hypothetical protein
VFTFGGNNALPEDSKLRLQVRMGNLFKRLRKIFLSYPTSLPRWTVSQAKKDNTDEAIAKYDGRYQLLLLTGCLESNSVNIVM